jgi:hypothetical protein
MLLLSHHALVPAPFPVKVRWVSQEPPFQFLPAVRAISFGVTRRTPTFMQLLAAHGDATIGCLLVAPFAP